MKLAHLTVTLGLAAALLGAPAHAAERVVRIANSPCICYLPMMVAVKKGWLAEDLAKAGVKMEVQVYQDGPSQIAALLSGSLDVAELGSSAAVSLIAKKAPVKIFMISDTELTTEGLVVRKAENISEVSGLVGKTIGVTAGSTSDYALRATLKTAGIDISKVKILAVPPPAMAAAWKRGDIAASYTWDPFLSQLARDGGTIIDTIGALSARTKGDYSIQNFYVTGADFAKKNPDILRIIGVSVSRAVEAIKADPAAIAGDFLQELGVETADEAVAQIKGEQFYRLAEQTGPALLGTPGKPGDIAATLVNVWQFSHDNGKVTTPPDRDAIVGAIDTSAFIAN